MTAKSKEKQIEEMARVLCGEGSNTCKKCVWGRCKVHHDAVNLYNAGYRKLSEVAKEIFAEIERLTKNHGITYTQRVIAELKKKYTEETDKENG